MIYWVFFACAVLLSIERITYYLIWRYPDAYRDLCARRPFAVFGTPVDVLQKLFYVFKLLQGAIFLLWCSVFADGAVPLPTGTAVSWAIGGAMILGGAFLNYSVFATLGKNGVFYGNKLGYNIPWRDDFPFSMFRHPQYVGSLLTIWGFFVVMRFPHDDWIVLPLLQTVYYWLGAHFER